MFRKQRAYVAVSAWAAVSVGCGRGPEAQSQPQPNDELAAQPAVNITFDLHSDPVPPNLPLEEKRLYFRRQLTNAEWLLDFVEPYGAKLSFLAVGEFYESCVEPSEQEACGAFLRRVQAMGGIIGTHQHTQYQRGVHDWPDIANAYANPAEADVRRVWADGHAATDRAVELALGLTDAEAVDAVNTACESHVKPADKNQLMAEYGYTIREGGEDQDFVPLFGHVPWNPFRPGDSPLVEDPSTPFVTIPQGMVIGQTGEHKGHEQDGRSPRKQAEFLELYATWLDHEARGAAPKVWTFGWGVHTQDLDVGSASRQAVTELVPWLASQFVDVPNPVARFAGYVEVRDEYLAWEAAHPGASSFSYEATDVDYAAYPYLEWANRYLRAATVEAELDGPAGVRVTRLVAGGHALLLAVAGGATGVVDASSLGAGLVRRVDLTTGETSAVDAAAAPVGPSSVVLCADAECDAILALGDAGTGGGDGTCTAADPQCGAGQVCATFLGRCVPDCRIATSPACPAQAPSCDQATGLCQAGTATLPANVAALTFSVDNPTTGNPWWAKAFFPDDAGPATRYPAVISVPGASGAGSTTESIADPNMNPAWQASAGFVVVVFDADGRGYTPGIEDFGGFAHQDGLKALIEQVATLDTVDSTQIALSTSSYGITMGSGVLARYPALPIRFLVDVEGPADRNDTGHCDASDTGHITHDCADDLWWSEREAVVFMSRVGVPYLRVQNVRDHAQPDNHHCILMMSAATGAAYGGSGVSPWTRVNLATQNAPNAQYDDAAPPVYNPNESPIALTDLWAELLAR